MKLGRIEDMNLHLLRIRERVTEEALPAAGTVLEIGPGEASFDKKGCRYVGANISMRGNPSVLADGHALPFRGGSFDFVIATEVIEHVRHPFKFLREIKRVLKPSGRVLLSTPNVAIPVNRVALAVFGVFPDDRTLHDGSDVGHIHFFTRKYLLEALRSEGFDVVRERDFLLQFLPKRYVYDTVLERWLPNLAKQIVVELAVRAA